MWKVQEHQCQHCTTACCKHSVSSSVAVRA